MPTYITEECINCAACEAPCPVEAISAGDELFIVDEAACTDCADYADEPECIAACPIEGAILERAPVAAQATG